MHEMGLPAVMQAIEKNLAEGKVGAAENLLWPALSQYPTVAPLWFYAGNVMVQTGRDPMAMICYQHSDELEPNAYVLGNLGAMYRRLNRTDESRTVLDLALFRDPNNISALANRGAVAVNNGNPAEGIPFLERAKELGTDHAADWNLALLYLEAGRFREGFELYATGIGHERFIRTYSWPGGPAEPALLTPESPRAGKTLIVYGEQGIGDELMYGTIIEQARKDFGAVIFDCHPRLEQLHRQAHPGMEIHPTRKDEHIRWPLGLGAMADYKAPIGELAHLYKTRRESFYWDGPIYRADPVDTRRYRKRLEEVAQGRPIVGLALRGGVMSTARQERTIRAETPLPLFRDTNALFVCLDYEDMVEMGAYLEAQVGPGRYLQVPAITQHWDYHHTAALVAATDLTVTVCQSVAHLSAGMGHPTRVLVPTKCAWRYGTTDTDWYWYPGPHAQLLRQDPASNSWEPAIAAAVQAIREIQP